MLVIVALVSVGLALAGVGLRWGAPGVVYILLGPLCSAHAAWSERRWRVQPSLPEPAVG